MMSLRPMVVDSDGIILGGNIRYRALQDLGFKEIPNDWVKRAEELTEDEKRRFIIADNVGFGDWDWDALANDWDVVDLEAWGLEIPGWKEEEAEAQEDDYEMPDNIQVDVVLGDLIEFECEDGRMHRLLCGDSTDSDEVAKLMNGRKADMVFTDPPYNIDYGNIKHSKFKQREIKNDNMSKSDFKDFCSAFASNIKLFCKGCVYVAAAPGVDGRIMFTVLDGVMHNSTVIIWNKDQFTLGRGKYQNKYEPIWFGWVNDGEGFTTQRNLANVWDIARPRKSEEHPTMKPIDLVVTAMNHASRKDDIILDLFLGSGTTSVAAHQLNRICYGMELDPKYCQVILDRMTKLDETIQVKINGKEYLKSTN